MSYKSKLKEEYKCNLSNIDILEGGCCCCNCAHQHVLHKHPWNKEFGKGSISEECGYVCLLPDMDGEGPLATYFDKKHGLCEMYYPKKQYMKDE